MPEPITPATTATRALERLDVKIWAAKSVREAVSIAGRGKHKASQINPQRVADVLHALIAALADTRDAILRDGRLP